MAKKIRILLIAFFLIIGNFSIFSTACFWIPDNPHSYSYHPRQNNKTADSDYQAMQDTVSSASAHGHMQEHDATHHKNSKGKPSSAHDHSKGHSASASAHEYEAENATSAHNQYTEESSAAHDHDTKESSSAHDHDTENPPSSSHQQPSDEPKFISPPDTISGDSDAMDNLLIADKKEKGGFSFLTFIRGLIGIAGLVLIAFLLSTDRKAIKWRVVFIGLLIQIVLAIGVLQVPFVKNFFEFFGNLFILMLDFTKEGTEFLFGDLVNTKKFGYIFAFQVLPTIIFFGALTSILFYLGIIQKIVYAMAWLLTKAFKLSGAESLSVTGNIFLGQMEAPLLVKEYIPKMTRSEIFLVMTGGLSTLAGGVLAAYIGFLGGGDPVQRLLFAKHLIAASVMAAPGAVVISKIMVPQKQAIEEEVHITRDKTGQNLIDAISRGTMQGINIAARVAGMLIVFIALIALLNFVFNKIGQWTDINAFVNDLSNGRYEQLSLQFMLGYIFSPIMWLIGMNANDIALAGTLLGEKIIMTEFIGYIRLSELKTMGAFASSRSIIMSTYMLSGFANFASVGMLVGGLGSIAPNQQLQLSRFGIRALIAGSLASLMSATIVGLILN